MLLAVEIVIYYKHLTWPSNKNCISNHKINTTTTEDKVNKNYKERKRKLLLKKWRDLLMKGTHKHMEA